MDRLSPTAGLISHFVSDPQTVFLILYVLVVVLSAIVYKLGFAKQLPVLKSVIVYAMLIIGCYPISIFAISFPVAESLFVVAFVLSVYKIRLHRSRRSGEVEG